MQRPIRNHVGASVPRAGTNATTEDSVVGKKVETFHKTVPAPGAPAPQAPRPPATSAVRSEPPMDVDPAELIPTIPPAGQAVPAPQAPVAIDDIDLEDDSELTLMFKRPEPPGPPRRPPLPKTKPAPMPAKPGAKLPLPAPRSEKSLLASPKVVERPLAPPPKPAAKPRPLTVEQKPLLATPAVNESPSVAPNPSERPLFEVTIGSEMPPPGTPEAGEISLLAPKAPNMPLLAAPQASDLASLYLKPGAAGAVSPLLALPMLDFSRDVSGLRRSSAPAGVATRMVGFARTHATWLVMTGGTVLIAGVSWVVFQAAAAGSETAAGGSARAAMPGVHSLAANPAPRAVATAQAATAAQPVATAEPDPVAPEPAPVEKNGLAEALAAAAAATAPATEQSGSAAEAVRPGAAAPTAETSAAAERPERPAPVAAVEPAPRPSGSRGTSSRSDSTELPAAKAAPEPVSAPAPAAPVAPSAGGFDGTADFDQSAAMAALREAAESARRCQTPDAPSGGVRIAVTFARTGAVSATQVEGSVAGTPLGNCVVAKFQNVHVPPFRGSVMTVRKTVVF